MHKRGLKRWTKSCSATTYQEAAGQKLTGTH